MDDTSYTVKLAAGVLERCTSVTITAYILRWLLHDKKVEVVICEIG